MKSVSNKGLVVMKALTIFLILRQTYYLFRECSNERKKSIIFMSMILYHKDESKNNITKQKRSNDY